MGSVFGPVRFLLPVCRISWFLYTLNIYAHFSSHFSQQLLMTQIWYLVTSFISVPHIVGSAFGPIRFILLVCRLCWFLYTLNIYAHFIVAFFSANIDGRNLIFGHKLHIGTLFCGSIFWPVRFLLPVCWRAGYHRWALAHSSSCLICFEMLTIIEDGNIFMLSTENKYNKQ